MGTKVISELASWFRKLDATSASLFILVFAAVALLRSPEIKSAVAAQEPTWWPELVEPAGWAAIAVALRVLGVQAAVVRLRVALSPKYRFRRLAPHADARWLLHCRMTGTTTPRRSSSVLRRRGYRRCQPGMRGRT